MAGHSKFKNIMHRKGAQDKKRANAFNKIAREITVATKMGAPDPNSNPRLRAAILAGRAINMPNDRIDRAIKAGTPGGTDGKNYEDVRYEGFGPGGIAIIVDCLTDNRARTVSDLRLMFTKHGGNLGDTGSVGFMFDRVGIITYPAKAGSADKVFELAVEAGADNVESSDDGHEIVTSPDNLAAVRDALEQALGAAESAKLTFKAQQPMAPADFESAQKLMNLLDALDDNDDVQDTVTNADIPAEWLEKLAA
ncbi:MAG: YebC/PmpR family DNA-binding transcriptional regulator [Bdellovibrionales bacterium]